MDNPLKDFYFDAVRDLYDKEDSKIESVEELFNVSFEELEDSMSTIESLEDLFSVSFEELQYLMQAPESLDDLFNVSFENLDDSMPVASNILSPEDENSTNFKRKSHHNFQPDFKRTKLN